MIHSGSFAVRTNSALQLIDITEELRQALLACKAGDGAVHLYNPHTTAGLTINEGADPAVQRDLIAGWRHMVPFDLPYQHQEGNSPAHLLASLIGCSITVLVDGGKLQLGTWQRIFFCEFDGPRTRHVSWRFMG